MNIQKKEDKRGRIYYVNTETGVRASRTNFIKANVQKIRNGQIKYDELQTKEKQSFNAVKRTTYKGKFLSSEDEKQVLKVANKSKDLNIKKGQDLTNVFQDQDPRELLKKFNKKGWIEPARERKTQTDIFAAPVQLGEMFKKGKQIKIVDQKGKEHFGLDAIEILRAYEQQRGEELEKEGLHPIFIHSFEEKKLPNGETIIIVDLDETEEIKSKLTKNEDEDEEPEE